MTCLTCLLLLCYCQGIRVVSELSEGQLEAFAGGELLQSSALVGTVDTSSKAWVRSSRKLLDALQRVGGGAGGELLNTPQKARGRRGGGAEEA